MPAADQGSPRVVHADLANAIRFLSADAVQAANSGHPGMPMGMADVATVLFQRFMKFDPSRPHWPDRDRFVLSAGHGSMLLYSLLYLTGYPDMSLDEIKNFRQLSSRTAGHPEYGHAMGVETTTGPLGQGLATAAGMALAEKMMKARFGEGLVDHHTYVIAGDGCLMEGVSQEAISMAGHLKLEKLIVLWDDNAISIDGGTGLSVSDDQIKRFEASGWDCQSVDGHNPDAVAAAIQAAKRTKSPSMIACKTVIGRGAPNKEGTAAAHGAPLGGEEIAAARDAMGWVHGPFEVPEDVLKSWRAIGAQGAIQRKDWTSRLLASEHKDEFNRLMNGEPPDGLRGALEAFKARCLEETPEWATRKASGETLGAITPAAPELIGGSADLTGSVNTKTRDMEPVTPADFSGRYVHYGVREHGMAAAMNGMALHGGLIPYGGTFLVFADYMRGAMRLSALMGTRVVYVLTHDSIGLGEDGPTHQPVETLAMLRATPNFVVLRPCDPIEVAEAWEVALTRTSGPTGLVLTRQAVPALRDDASENKTARGAYVLKEASSLRKAVLFATGSEVSIAVEARAALEADGVPTALVSVPSWELFESQDDAYKAQVLGEGGARVAVEAAVGMGWERFVGTNGGFVGMTGFGASAPAGDLYKHFDITADAVAREVKARL